MEAGEGGSESTFGKRRRTLRIMSIATCPPGKRRPATTDQTPHTLLHCPCNDRGCAEGHVRVRGAALSIGTSTRGRGWRGEAEGGEERQEEAGCTWNRQQHLAEPRARDAVEAATCTRKMRLISHLTGPLSPPTSFLMCELGAGERVMLTRRIWMRWHVRKGKFPWNCVGDPT